MSVISEEELSEIVEVVWMTVLELPVKAGSRADLLASEYITASIVISGAWHGVVNVQASLDFLRRAAAHMFTINVDEIELQDCMDTLTELTNMLGGTIKCLLPEICDLSLPTIIERTEDAEEHQDWLYFTCAAYPLALSLVEHDQPASQAA